jgi:HAE1 family hydrophobic/amphiphilic exporter-1
MGVTDTFIRRPVATTLLMISLLAAGIVAYGKLPTSDLPSVDYPTLTVSATLPGANPQTVASSLAAPLERAFADISGLEVMTSTSYAGSTSITLQFSMNQNINTAAQDVQASISKANLPSNMPRPPSYSKSNSSASPIYYLTLSSETMPLYRVNELAKNEVTQRIARVPGVAQVMIYGERKYAVRVRVDPRQLAVHQVDLATVANAIPLANSNLPSGNLEGPDQTATIKTDGQLLDAEPYNQITLVSDSGQVLRVSQVGRSVASVENDKSGVWWNGEPCITLAVTRQPSSNTVAVVDAVKAMLPEIRQEMPPGVDMKVLMDASQPIRDSVEDVQLTLILAVALVVAVVFVFLRTLTATIVTSLSVPLSLLGALPIMYMLGFSLDTLSLMALTLAVGFVVDDAIIVLENIVRHLQMGKTPLQAALDGAREISFTVISTTLSLVAVFLPVALMSGMLGRLLFEFAITVSVAILLSGVVALTMVPMLCSRVLKPMAHREGQAALEPEEEGGFIWRRLAGAYRLALDWCLRHRLVTVAVAILLAYINVHLFMAVPKGFIPSEDRGYFMAFTVARQGIAYEAMSQHTNAVAAVIAAHPGIKGVLPIVGQSTMNQAMIVALLKDKSQRKQGVEDIIAELRPKVAQYPGVMCMMSNPPPIDLSTGGGGGQGNYQYNLVGTKTDDLYQGAQELVERLRRVKEITDINSNLMIANPEVMISIDRARADLLGIGAQTIENSLYSAFGSRRVSTIYSPGDEYAVYMEMAPEFRLDPSALRWLYMKSSTGGLVPLPVVAKVTQSLGPVQVNHFGQLPSVTISFNLPPGVSLGLATEAIRQQAREVLPATVSGSFEGTAKQFESSLTSMMVLIGLALGVIYVILGILYESYLHPLTILAGLPSAILGALLTLKLFGAELNLYGYVGLILLIGIVKKNAIMMIDFALEAERQHGKTAMEAVREGALVRLRPIMMTTVAAFMGILPIALGLGAGGESRQPLGLAVCGGLVFSQVVTLLITPVIYTYFDQLQNWWRDRHAAEPAS